jgi:hypothetical protein
MDQLSTNNEDVLAEFLFIHVEPPPLLFMAAMDGAGLSTLMGDCAGQPWSGFLVG